MTPYGSHPADVERDCSRCGKATPHLFRATVIVDDEPDVREVHAVTCLVCGAEHDVLGASRPDLGGDELGWTFARRAPGPAACETVRPPAFSGAP